MNAREAMLTAAFLGFCCALPILLISGVSIGAGLLLGEIALIAVGLGGIAYAAYRVARRKRML
ncbi:MAG: hypothetical protein QN168_01790 [Armatimonadota bacterium]|nr:hypothetical protein [Armatimonadota bacterium]